MHSKAKRDKAAALVIVLAFVVIITGLVVAYLARTTTNRQLANGSFNNNKADILARSALDIIVGTFKEEITTGVPITSVNIVPQRSPEPGAGGLQGTGIPNLIRRSVRDDAIPVPAVSSLASAVNSLSDPALGGRVISLARWNAHYMVPKAAPGDSSPDPITTGFSAPDYWAPDWVIVTRNGPTPFNSWDPTLADKTSSNQGYAVGRYAYAVYDEGGLLDANVVGLPSPTPAITAVGRKGTMALADITAMKYTPSGSTASATAISKIVGWRNYATVQSSGTFPSLSPTPDPSPFMAYVLDTSRDFRNVSAAIYLGHTDQAFLDRKDLIAFVRVAGPSINMLQFLGTFSREQNIPTFQVAGANLTTRFALGNLALLKDKPEPSLAAEIKQLFGLQWVDGTPGAVGPPVNPATPGHWQYVGKTGTAPRSTIGAFTGEPDFFQLLNYAVYSTTSDDATHIDTTLTLGATIIDQYDDDSSVDPTTNTTSTMIEYGGGNWATGMENVDPARPSPSPQPSPFPPPAGMSPTPRPFIAGYTMLNRPFRNVGEIGYALRPEKSPAPQTVDFLTSASQDAPILDLFTYNTAPLRAGIVSLNSANPGVFAAILKSAITNEATPGTGVGLASANNAAASPTPYPTSGIIGHTTLGTMAQPALGRSGISRLVEATGTSIGSTDEEKETVARAIAEVTQTRTWGLFIDVIAQSGRYPPNAKTLASFTVEGEKRYWLHIAIDRFTGEILDRQIEAVDE